MTLDLNLNDPVLSVLSTY